MDSYAVLVAASVLRDKDFASRWGPFVSANAASLLGHYALADVVKIGLERYVNTGEVPRTDLLRADLTFLSGGTHERQARLTALEAVEGASVTPEVLEHVGKTVRREAVTRGLGGLAGVAGSPDLFFTESDKLRELWTGQNGKVHSYRFAELLRKREEEGVSPGMPTGFDFIDRNLRGGGLHGGMALVWLADYNVGKTTSLVQVTRHFARRGDLVLFVSYENSQPEEIIERFHNGAEPGEDTDSWALSLMFPHGPEVDASAIEAEARRVRSAWGKPLSLIVRDYGEISASDPTDFHAVRNAYLNLKRVGGRLGCAVMDAAQNNRYGQASYHDILKDMDVIVDLAPADEQTLAAKIRRNRAGPKGASANLLTDFRRNTVQQIGGA